MREVVGKIIILKLLKIIVVIEKKINNIGIQKKKGKTFYFYSKLKDIFNLNK